MIKEYEIWMEGYSATGESSEAKLIGTMYADSFQEACDQWAISYGPANYYDSKRLSYWACRLFDNEKDARKGYG